MHLLIPYAHALRDKWSNVSSLSAQPHQKVHTSKVSLETHLLEGSWEEFLCCQWIETFLVVHFDDDSHQSFIYMAVHDYKLIDGCFDKNLEVHVARLYQIKIGMQHSHKQEFYFPDDAITQGCWCHQRPWN